MRELRAVIDTSDSATLVLHDVETGEEFFLPVTAELREYFHDSSSDSSSADATVKSEPAPVEDLKQRPHRASISLSPREIQDRIRHGATIADLAAEADTSESRIEPYAWPILQERAQVAESAHSARPIVADGASPKTLWEILATALAARGSTLSDAVWDAHQDASKRWIITVSWNKTAAGQSATHIAEFLLERTTQGADLVHPLNSIAGDLLDPRFGQPVRRVAPVTSLIPMDSPGAPHTPHSDEAENSMGNLSAEPIAADTADEDDLLIHPPEQEKPRSGRKRKAVTPHWEDVLLGVRTNPKKKK